VLTEDGPLRIEVPRDREGSDDAASKLIWLALRNITAERSRAAKEWKLAMNQFAILYEERFTQVAHGAGR
jgi:transposase-like protein